MAARYELKPEELKNFCNPSDLNFQTTKDIKPLEGIIGQNRGIEALKFGLSMKQNGYNIFVTGNSGTGRSSFTDSIAREYAKKRPVPNDWVYVYNFANKDVPKALSLSPGTGRIFKNELDLIIDNFRKYIPEVFESKEYESKKSDIYRLSLQKKGQILKRMNEKSSKLGFSYTTSEEGLVSVPLIDGRPMNEEEYQNLSIEAKEELMIKYDELQGATYEEFNDIRELEDEYMKNIKQLDKNVITELVNFDIYKLIDKYEDNSAVVDYLQDLRNDILENINKFKTEEIKNTSPFQLQFEKKEDFFIRYKVNLFIDNSNLEHAPIIKELGTGEHNFGKPSRITASVYCGKDGVINIERESNQSGNMHDKGVLILSGFLGEKYALKRPLGLTIGIGFEQNYSIIDGDSASSTELYAILSSMADVPIKQYIAVTGSVNQKGEIQPIGGVNEKIEGFYEICKQKGLNGKQGVIIPKQNIKNLMLKQEIIDAVDNERFHIYAIEHVEEGIEILTGLQAGKLNDFGEYEEGSLNYRIMKRLDGMECRLQKA